MGCLSACIIGEYPSIINEIESYEDHKIKVDYLIGVKTKKNLYYKDIEEFKRNYTSLDKKIDLLVVPFEKVEDIRDIISKKIINKGCKIFIKIDKSNLKAFFKLYKELLKVKLSTHHPVRFIDVKLTQKHYFYAIYEVI